MGEMADNDLHEAAQLAKLIEYQAGSIVSRMLLNKKGGSVTLFSLDEGQTIAEHTTPFDALVFVIDGEAEITISGKPSMVKSGEVLLMPANDPHALKAIQKFKMVLTMIKSGWKANAANTQSSKIRS